MNLIAKLCKAPRESECYAGLYVVSKDEKTLAFSYRLSSSTSILAIFVN